MCAGTLVHISRHQGKTSNNNNNNKRCQPLDLLYALPSLLLSGFTSDFRFYDYYTILDFTRFHHPYSIPPVSCSYLIIPWVLPAWYHLLYIYMLMLTTRFSMHDYDSVLSLHVCLSFLATWHSYHHSPREFYLTPLDPHVQVLELGAYGFSQLLIRVAQR